MPQRGLAEGHELDPDAGGIRIRRHREVRAGESRRGADGRQQVLDEREMEHLLRADLEQRLPPSGDRRQRFRRQALFFPLLERESCEEVLEHHEVLQLGGLADGVDQGLPVLDAAGMCVVDPAPDLDHVRERTLGDGIDDLGHRDPLRRDCG